MKNDMHYSANKAISNSSEFSSGNVSDSSTECNPTSQNIINLLSEIADSTSMKHAIIFADNGGLDDRCYYDNDDSSSQAASDRQARVYEHKRYASNHVKLSDGQLAGYIDALTAPVMLRVQAQSGACRNWSDRIGDYRVQIGNQCFSGNLMDEMAI